MYDGQAWTVPCKVNVVFALSIGGGVFPVDMRDLAFSPVDPDDPSGICTSGFSSGSVGQDTEWLVCSLPSCSLLCSYSPYGMVITQVGDVFLKNVYMSTNVGTDKISFAKLAD